MFIFEKAPFLQCHASTIEEIDEGVFLAAWFGGKSEGARDVKIWGAKFTGKKWSVPFVLAEEPGHPCWNPVLFLSQNETLMLFYKAGPSPKTWSGFVRRSTDRGKTWSDPEILPAGLYGPVKNKPIQLKDGSILAGTSVESHRAWCCWVDRSTDDGKTWQRHGPIQVPGKPFGLIQPTLLETSDGRILALCRSKGIKQVCSATSSDGGKTWTDAKPTKLPNPNSGIDAVRTSKGDFFLIYNNAKLGRFPLAVAKSTDNGQTWEHQRNLEEHLGEFSYPSVIQASDGNLHVVYTWNRRHIKHVIVNPKEAKEQPSK